MNNELKSLIDYAISLTAKIKPEVIMQRKEEEFIAIPWYLIPYAESDGYRFYGTIAELTA